MCGPGGRGTRSIDPVWRDRIWLPVLPRRDDFNRPTRKYLWRERFDAHSKVVSTSFEKVLRSAYHCRHDQGLRRDQTRHVAQKRAEDAVVQA